MAGVSYAPPSSLSTHTPYMLRKAGMLWTSHRRHLGSLGPKLQMIRARVWGNKLFHSADCKRGRRKGATSKNVKNRQKVSKSFSTLFDSFRAGQKTSKIVKKCQKVFRHFSTIFARHLFSGPFCNPLIHESANRALVILLCLENYFCCQVTITITINTNMFAIQKKSCEELIS